MKVGVAKETAPGERRVALVPESIARLSAAGVEVLVESGAGAGALIPDQAYADAGAKVVKGAELFSQADVILKVQKPNPGEVRRLHSGQGVIAFLQPLIDPKLAQVLAKKGVTAISLDAIPRTLSRAQTMDALSSQANVGGYKAVLLAANAFGRYFPLLTTAAGTAKPANVLILGIGVAGLQAIGTARRLGAVVRAYDVRSETKEQAESLGAQFIVLKSVADASGEGGYARQLTKDEQKAQQDELNGHIANMDVVITTAQVPGRRPPLLVTTAAIKGMKPGSVIIDMAASDLGGNVELSKPGQTIVTRNGVTIIAPENLPASMPVSSSQFYARNISALLLGMVKDGRLNLDFEDPVTKSTVISHGGKLLSDAVQQLLQPSTEKPGEPSAHARTTESRAETPATEKLAADKAAAERTAADKPAADKAAAEKPAARKTGAQRTAADKAAAEKPAAEKPAAGKRTSARPLADRPAPAKPTPAKPTPETPDSEKPTAPGGTGAGARA